MQRNGSATSSTLDTSRQATLTSEASWTCGPTTSPDTGNATSSPASAAGRSPCGSPDGQMTDLFGQALAPASPSLPPAKARRPMTNATCGLRGFLLSESAALQSSLESRLRRQLDGAGSTLFSLIWKQKATPAGRPYYQLAASALRTSDSDAGSWPTPNAGPQNDGDTTWQERRTELKTKHGNGNGFGLTLGQAVSLCNWATPTSRDSRSEYGTPEMMARRQARSEGKPLSKQALLAAWV